MKNVFQLINALLHEIDGQYMSEEKQDLYDYASYKMFERKQCNEKDYKKFKLANAMFNFLENEIKKKGN